MKKALIYQYEIYVPLNYNNGKKLEKSKIRKLKSRLTKEFGGLTEFPQKNKGSWSTGGQVFKDQINILRIIAKNKSKSFFTNLKKWIKKELQQESVLITCHKIKII